MRASASAEKYNRARISHESRLLGQGPWSDHRARSLTEGQDVMIHRLQRSQVMVEAIGCTSSRQMVSRVAWIFIDYLVR